MTSAAERFDDHRGGLSAGKVLLTGNEVPVADGKTTPEAGLDVVRSELLQLVLDPPRHHVLVSRKKIRRPYHIVGEILLDVGKSGDRLSLRQQLTIGAPRIAEYRHAVAKRGRDLAGF